MNRPPNLTDRRALTRNRARAQAEPALFLHEAIADEIQERLAEVNKSFTAPVIISGWPDFWGDAMPGASQVGDTDTLDLAPNKHDLIIHALCLHWASDPIGQLVQCRHALCPDGLLITALFGGQTLHELRSALAEAESRVTGGLSPRVAPMGEIRDLGSLLQRAGFAMPVADVLRFDIRYETPWHLMRDLRAMGEANALAGRLKRPTRKAVLTEAARIYAENFSTEDGRVRATFEVVVLTGWAPDASQPQPLRPGSAKTRLADALGGVEMPLDGADV